MSVLTHISAPVQAEIDPVAVTVVQFPDPKDLFAYKIEMRHSVPRSASTAAALGKVTENSRACRQTAPASNTLAGNWTKAANGPLTLWFPRYQFQSFEPVVESDDDHETAYGSHSSRSSLSSIVSKPPILSTSPSYKLRKAIRNFHKTPISTSEGSNGAIEKKVSFAVEPCTAIYHPERVQPEMWYVTEMVARKTLERKKRIEKQQRAEMGGRLYWVKEDFLAWCGYETDDESQRKHEKIMKLMDRAYGGRDMGFQTD